MRITTSELTDFPAVWVTPGDKERLQISEGFGESTKVTAVNSSGCILDFEHAWLVGVLLDGQFCRSVTLHCRTMEEAEATADALRAQAHGRAAA